jgi:hypothetical protein
MVYIEVISHKADLVNRLCRAGNFSKIWFACGQMKFNTQKEE